MEWEDSSGLHPNVAKFLNFLGKAEGADYNTIVGGSSFSDFSRHPEVVGLRTKEGPSTAAGRYQITKTTYNDVAPALGINDFSQKSQDLIATELIRRKNALGDVVNGNFDEAVKKLGGVWASLPSSPYSQPKRDWNFVKANLTGGGGGWEDAPSASSGSGWEDAPAAPQAAPQPAATVAPKLGPSTPEKKKEDNRSVLRRVDDFMRGIADTVTFGYADEIAGKLDSLVGGGQSGKKTYQEAVKAQRQRDTEGGYERIAGQVGGAFVPGAAAVGVVRAVPTAGRLARAGAGAATGTIQGGLYGSGSAEEGNRIEGAKTGALIGAATGGVLGGVLPATTAQKGSSFIKNSGDDAAARIDAEIVSDVKKLADSATKRGNPVTTIDLNAIESKYINDVNRAVTALGKVDKSFDAGPLRAALQDRRALTPDDLAPLRSSPAGTAVADAIEKAQRARSMTQAMQSSGGVMPLLREGVDLLPLPAFAQRGLKAALGGRQTREVAAQNVLKQADAAENVLQRLGPSQATRSAQELDSVIKQADNDFLGRVMGLKRDQLATKRIADEAAAKAAAEKEAAKLLKAQEGRMISEGGRLLADKKAAEKAALTAEKSSTKAPKKGPLDNFIQKAVSESDEQMLKVREFQQLGDNPTDLVSLANKATPAPTSVDDLPISDIIRKVSLETDAAFIPNGKTYLGNEIKNVLNVGKTTQAATSAQKAAAKAEAKIADKEARALAEKAKVDSFLSGELPGNLSTEAGGFQATMKYVNGTADEIAAGLRQLAKDRPDLAPNILDMFAPGKKAKNLYEIQNNLFKTLGKREQPAALTQGGGVLTPETSRVFNQTSYDATVRTAEAARDAAIKSAPSPSLKQFAIDVANEKSPAAKVEKLQERLKAATDPEELGYLLNMVEPLTKFGKKK